ncbi:MAG: hypothetical protein Kow00107_04840 [Planctomycetota bacterium]
MKNATLLPMLFLLFLGGLAMLAFAEDEPAVPETLVSKVFDISAVSASEQQRIFQYPRLGFDYDADEAFELMMDELMYPGEVVDYIYNETGPENWSAAKGTYITQLGEDKITVRNTELMVAMVEGTLGKLMPKRLSWRVTGAVYHFADNSGDGITLDLAHKQFENWAAATEIMKGLGAQLAFSFNTVLKTNRSSVQATTEKSEYLKEYIARVANFTRGYELITGTYTVGYVVGMKVLESEGKATLNVKFDACHASQIQTFETPAGTLQKPSLRMYSTRPSSVAIEPGKTAVFTHSFGKDAYVLIIGVSE